ncbi:MAG: hypothetical protein J6Y20_07235 [Lachnospiraceae bacterium]|nr:hypothetical protein [Lachnospiraceae bacterium]
MKLQLQKMLIQNFKGIESLGIEFNETETNIRGMNGLGKTSIVDAYSWCIWEKDAKGNAPGSDHFRVKPLDETGQERHNLETSVELICTVDGAPFNIKRVQTEKWVREKGALEAKFSANVTTLYINGVKLKQTEFKARINELCNDELFRYIGTLSAFNQTEWKKRRSRLMAMATPNNTTLADPNFASLAEELKKRGVSVTELRKVLSDENLRTRKNMDAIPARIDEINRAMPVLTEREIKDAEYNIADIQNDLDNIDRYISETLEKPSPTDGTEELEAQLRKTIAEITGKYAEDVRAASNTATQKFLELHEAKKALNKASADANAMADKLAAKAEERQRLRDEFMSVRDASAPEVATVCPTCGQPLPAEKVDEAKAKYEQAREKRLAEIRAAGVKAAEECKTLQEQTDVLREQFVIASTKADAIEKSYNDAAMAEKALRDAGEPDARDNPAVIDLMDKIELKKKASTRTAVSRLDGYRQRQAELKERLLRAQAVKIQQEQIQKSTERIEALNAERKELGIALGENERLIMLIDEYVVAQCREMEQDINSHFPTVRWKLFDKATVGSVSECCTCLIPCDGNMVAYECANTASQINADIEIANALSKFYGIMVPLFVDNAERVVNIAHTDTQVIKLTVTKDETLIVE